MTGPLDRKLSRRTMLKFSGIAAAGVLVGCAPAAPTAAPTAVPKPQATTAPQTQATAVPKATEAPKTAATAAPQPTAVPKATEAPKAAAGKTAEEILGNKKEFIPGSPDHARGWKTTFGTIPAGIPWTPPIKINESRRVDASSKYVGNDDINNNPMTRMYKALFGIQWNCSWTRVTNDEHAQKLNVAMASGDLPDLMETVPATLFSPLLEAKMVEDITDVYDQTVKPDLKQRLEWGEHILWSYAEVNKRKMGWPHIEGAAEDENVLNIRKDWLDKVGMKLPDTLDDVAAVAKAFQKANLGKGNTIGLLAGNAFVSWYASLDPMFGCYGTMPGSWIDDGKGGLKFGTVQPEMKGALQLLNQWYKDKVLAGDFFTLGSMDSAKFVEGGQAGMFFCHGVSYGGLGSVANDPNAKWTWVRSPAHPTTGLRKHWWHNPCVSNIFTFRKGFKNVKEVLHQTNFDVDWALDPANRMHGFEDYSYKWLPNNTIDPQSTAMGFARWAFGLVFCAGNNYPDPYKMKAQIGFRQKYRAEVPKDKWDAMMERQLDDPTGLAQLDDEIRLFLLDNTDKDTIKNRFVRLPTPTMVTSWASLQKLADATNFGIVTGEKSIGDFDKFVADWKAQGGDKITQEVNEWWAAKSK